MPVAVSSSASRERRVGSAGGSTGSGRSASVGGARRAKSSSTAVKSSSTTSSTPPILRTSSPSSPPVKGILVNKQTGDHDQRQHGDDGEEHTEESTTSSSNAASTASSYLKPLLKYLPRHIDPSTIARLLKNVHPSAFGAYRTKEAWRREHPHVLNTAYHLQREEESNGSTLDVQSAHAAIRPSTSSSDENWCLAHSPPSATFSSSEDDADVEEGDFDEDYITAYGRRNGVVEEEGEDDDFDRKEAKELEDYFNDDFDADLGTSPESASSLRDLHDGVQHQQHAWNGSNDSNNDTSRRTSVNRRARTSSQDSNTTSATAKNDTEASSSSGGFLEEAAAALTSPRSPLAIYLSKPDEEHDSPLAGPSQRVLDAYTTSNNNNNNDDSSSSMDEANDSGATITYSTFNTSQSHLRTSSNGEQYRQPIASTSAAILYPDFKRRDSVELTPRTPPSPSASSPPPSPSSLSPSQYHQSHRSPSSSRSQSYSTSINENRSSSRSPQHYPTIPIPRIIKRQTSSSSIASSSACTCRSNASQVSNASVSSRSSSIKFAPLPEEEIASARRESRSRNGGKDSGKSKVMGIKGRRNLLLGLKGEDDELQSPSPSTGRRNDASDFSRSALLDENEEDGIQSSDDDDDGYAYTTSRNSSSARHKHTSNGNGSASKDQFDALAYFGEEDLLNPPPPAFSHRGKGNTTSDTLKEEKNNMESSGSGKGKKKNRQDSDATIRYGKNGELVERRPLGVTLEELTLPMKRVKETRGRSRQTNDLSAGFTSPRSMRSPPLSPSQPQANSKGTFSPPMSPTRSGHASKPEASDETTTSPDASHEKTPMPTPKLEKKRFEMFTNITPLSPPSSLPTSPPVHLPLSPTALHAQDTNIAMSTSPSQSTHFGGSNEITPMPTPRAGSPISGLKMTTSIFEERGQASSKGFKLMDTFTTRSSGSSTSPTSPSKPASNGSEDRSAVEEPKVSSLVNLLALGGLLDDVASAGESPSPGSSVPSMTTSGSSPERTRTTSECSEETVSEKLENGSHVSEEEEIVDDDPKDADGSEDLDFDKTPTLHTSLDLPKLDETTHALHARYRKKRSVGIPHGVTAKKKPVISSRKGKKS